MRGHDGDYVVLAPKLQDSGFVLTSRLYIFFLLGCDANLLPRNAQFKIFGTVGTGKGGVFWIVVGALGGLIYSRCASPNFSGDEKRSVSR